MDADERENVHLNGGTVSNGVAANIKALAGVAVGVDGLSGSSGLRSHR